MGLAYLKSAGGLFTRRGPILRGGEVGSAGPIDCGYMR